MPCEYNILPDGTCQYGMPALMPENRKALELYTDLKALGWEAVVALHDLSLNGQDRGELLMRFRAIASEVALIEREKLQAAGKGGVSGG